MEKEFRVILDDYGTHGFAACQCPECKKVIVLKKEMLKGVHDGYLPEIIKCDCGYQGSRINSSELASNHFLWLAATFLMVVISIVMMFLDTKGYFVAVTLAISVVLTIITFVTWKIKPEIVEKAKSAIYLKEAALRDNETNLEKECWNSYRKEVEQFKSEKAGRIIQKKDGERVYIGRDEHNLYLMPIYKDEGYRTSDISQWLGVKKVEKVHDALWSQKVKTIPRRNIDYFMLTGGMRYETKISGGNSGIQGAAVGYALGGAIGAAVLANPTEVKSEEIAHDERRVYMQYTNNEKTYGMNFQPEEYATLRALIPEKEYGVRR